MEQKHPVSLLQEFMVKHHKSLPLYEISDLSTTGVPKFACVVTAGGIKEVAQASSKQNAKKLAATRLLTQLGYDKLGSEIASLNYNAIGKLNEFTAQKKMLLPNYKECGVNQNGEFIIACTLQEYYCEGTGTTKKVAKQMAAHSMITLLEDKKDITASFINKTNMPNDDIILQKLRALSITNRGTSTAHNPCEEPKLNEILAEQHSTNTINIFKEGGPGKTQEELYEELKALDISYSIDTMQRNPYTLRLTFSNKDNSTVIANDDDYNLAYIKLLQAALQITSTWKDVTSD